MLQQYVNLPRAVHILCLGVFINRAGSFVLVFLTIYLSEQLGYSETFAARCMGALGLGSMFATLIGGQLADQIGRRFVMLVALFGGAGLLVLLSFAESQVAILSTIAAYGLVAETFRPACSAMIGDLTQPEQRPAAFGLFYIAINLGFACGPPIGGILAEVSYSLLFWADACTMAVFGGIIVFAIVDTRALATDDDSPPTIVPMRAAVERILSDRIFLMFCGSTVLISLVFMQSVSTLPMFIKQSGYTNFQFGLLMGINGILIFVCQLPLTHALERFHPMANLIAGGILIAIGFGTYAFPSTMVLMVCSVLVWTTGEMMQAPFKQTIVTNMAPGELRARYLGLFGLTFSLALTIGAPLGGEILNRYGARSLWTLCFIVAGAAVAGYALTYRSLIRQRASENMTDVA